MANVYMLSDHVYDSIITLVTEMIDFYEETDFDTRREYLGRIAELNEILDELQGATR